MSKWQAQFGAPPSEVKGGVQCGPLLVYRIQENVFGLSFDFNPFEIFIDTVACTGPDVFNLRSVIGRFMGENIFALSNIPID